MNVWYVKHRGSHSQSENLSSFSYRAFSKSPLILAESEKWADSTEKQLQKLPLPAPTSCTQISGLICVILICVQSPCRSSKADPKGSLVLTQCQELPSSRPKRYLQTALKFTPVTCIKGGLASLHSHWNKEQMLPISVWTATKWDKEDNRHGK